MDFIKFKLKENSLGDNRLAKLAKLAELTGFELSG